MPEEKKKNPILRLADRDGRYQPEAFVFIQESVGVTVQMINNGEIKRDSADHDKNEFHVTGQELLRGVLRLSRDRWGMLAPVVFDFWGIHSTEDFGEIVFLMVEDEEMEWKKRDCDSRKDFANGFDFATSFLGNDVFSD